MKIGILLAVEDKSEFTLRFPNDGLKFAHLLQSHCEEWEFDVIAVVKGEFPTDFTDYDGYVITGSPSSANGSEDWIARLLDMIRNLVERRIPVFGACFGHQVVAKALGGSVESNPAGWSAGVSEIEFLNSVDWIDPGRRHMRLFSLHSEQVTKLPPGARVIATSRHCPISGFMIADHVFTTQYHPEFSAEFMSGLVDMLPSNALGPKGSSHAQEVINRGAEGNRFAELVAEFFRRANGDDDVVPEADPVGRRLAAAKSICALAGERALSYFRNPATLKVDKKGHQDYVSNADREVEELVRDEIARRFPEDGIIGEEYKPVHASSPFTWIIDPIDGTASFISGIPGWTVILACVRGPDPVIAVIHDPVHDEMHYCRRGGGAYLNGKPVQVAQARSLGEGTMGIGISSKGGNRSQTDLVRLVIQGGGNFIRTGSGGQLLGYTASGRLIGYLEEKMNSWDCLAGILLIEEAGGIVFDYGFESLARDTTHVIAAAPLVSAEVREISKSAFK